MHFTIQRFAAVTRFYSLYTRQFNTHGSVRRKTAKRYITNKCPPLSSIKKMSTTNIFLNSRFDSGTKPLSHFVDMLFKSGLHHKQRKGGMKPVFISPTEDTDTVVDIISPAVKFIFSLMLLPTFKDFLS